MKAIEIGITRNDKGELEVWCDGKTTGSLCFGEALEQVVKLLLRDGPLPNAQGYPMLTPYEWEAREEAFLADRAARERAPIVNYYFGNSPQPIPSTAQADFDDQHRK